MKNKTEKLRRVLIIFHWKNIVKYNGSIATTELSRRLKPITYLRKSLPDQRIDLNWEDLKKRYGK